MYTKTTLLRHLRPQALRRVLSSPDGRIQLLLYWAPLLAWMAAIFVLSSLSAGDIERSTPEGVPLASKAAFAHAVEFGVLALLVYRLLRYYRVTATPHLWSAVLLLTIGYALTDELHQSFVPGRVPSWEDIGFDSLGALIGLLVGEVGTLLRRHIGGGGRRVPN